jgi:Domain of unknown function (DUF4190)
MSEPGSTPPPGGEVPWWANPQGGPPPKWWDDPKAGERGLGGPPQPPRAPFHPGSDPAYARTYSPQPMATAKGAVAALVWGILSLVCCGAIGGAIAIYQGSQARFRIRMSNGRLGGNGMALAGMILGGISLFITAVVLFLWATGQYHPPVFSPTTTTIP